jgi:hypothetical protein
MYFAVACLDRREGIYVIRSPDLTDLEERCSTFAEVPGLARRAVRSALVRLKKRRKSPPPPTPRSTFEEEPRYRDCFLVAVAPDDGGSDGNPS